MSDDIRQCAVQSGSGETFKDIYPDLSVDWSSNCPDSTVLL